MACNFVGVTGLPRSGSTLMCQLLGQHPEVYCEGHSSPLCHLMSGIRRMVSDDPFFRAQMDRGFETCYGHLTYAMRGFLRSWYQDCTKKVLVDKNRGWLPFIETLLQLAPEARLVVCVREPGQIYGSIEAQHQRTVLVDFPDHMADCDRLTRAMMLFSKDRVVGGSMQSLLGALDFSPEVLAHLYFVRFEDLVDQPVNTMSAVYSWLGLSPFKIDPENLRVGICESDSHYNMKYLHRLHSRIVKPQEHEFRNVSRCRSKALARGFTRSTIRNSRWKKRKKTKRKRPSRCRRSERRRDRCGPSGTTTGAVFSMVMQYGLRAGLRSN